VRALSKFTLGQVLLVSLVAITALMSFAYSIAMRASSDALLFAADKLQDEVGADLSRRMDFFFGGAEDAINAFNEGVEDGAISRDPKQIRAALYALMLAHPNLTQLAFTGAVSAGRDADGAVIPAAAGRWQLSLSREGDAISEYQVISRGTGFVRVADGVEASAIDPTKHPTFRTPTREDFVGDLLWSDLHFAEGSKTVVVTVQKAIYGANEEFFGVLRAGLDYDRIGSITAQRIADAERANPGFIFLLNTKKEFIAGFPGHSRLKESDDKIRLEVSEVPREVREVLDGEDLSNLTDVRRGSRKVGNESVAYTFRKIPRSRGWVIATLVKTDEVLAPVTRSRDLGRVVSLLLAVLAGAIGVIILRTLKGFLEEIVDECARLNEFRFDGNVPPAPFRDLRSLSESFVRTKAALRTMSKYASVDLVRDLYQSRREASLGAESRELTVLFTDIKDFTTITESTAPNELAAHMGIYFSEMIEVVHKRHLGTVDKFIGDALLVFWNAPHPVPDHPQRACEAALLCREITRRLRLRPEWGGFPDFATRFGIHTDTVLVGHFGAPERMNYGVLGDGVNLASRLESLNKFFGTQILVSDATRRGTVGRLFFREIDEVAVKGRAGANRIYELVGFSDALSPLFKDTCLRYEEALGHYRRADFTRAIALLEQNGEDLPSQKLLSRIRDLVSLRPADWEPVFRLNEK
jgi:adenylate cyclase